MSIQKLKKRLERIDERLGSRGSEVFSVCRSDGLIWADGKYYSMEEFVKRFPKGKVTMFSSHDQVDEWIRVREASKALIHGKFSQDDK